MATASRLLARVISVALLSTLMLTSVPSEARAQRAGLSWRFGVIEPHDAPEYADALGVGWGRARFHWALVQPTSPDEWIEAEISDDELSREINAGREVIGLLIGIPDWARDENGLPRGLYLPYNDPDNLWASYVRQAVTRYQGEIKHWIIWNEPDVWDSSHPSYTWPGSEADFVQLLKVAYLTAKEANPQAVIHLAAVSHWWDALYGRELYFSRLMDALIAEPEAAQHNYYYDVATLHLYFNPASVYELIETYASIQAEHGINKPIWLIETNAAPSSDPIWPVAEPTFRVSLLEQAAYIPQALSLALAAGVERVGIYKLVDTPGDYAANPEPFGLVRADGSTRPAYQTAQVAIQQLAGAERVIWAERGATSLVTAEGSGQITRILWSRVPEAQTAHIPALADMAVLLDMWGNATTLIPQDGTYTVTLFAGECQQTVGDYCMIGGPPVYVIEAVPEWGDIPPAALSVANVEGDISAMTVSPASNRTVLNQGVLVMAGIACIIVVGMVLGYIASGHWLRRDSDARRKDILGPTGADN